MLDDIRAEKIKKMNNFKNSGIDPYPAGPFHKESSTAALEKKTGESVQIAGRIMLFREMGNITFLTIQNEFGRIQIVISKNKLVDQDYKFWVKNLDLGDFIGIEEERFTTEKGEESVLANKLTLLAKSILPLPDKHKSLKMKKNA